MAYKYVADNAAVKALRAEPCSSIVDANLTYAVNNAEDKVDAYLAQYDITVPIAEADITGDLKEAVAVMTQACISYSYGYNTKGMIYEKEAQVILDKYRKSIDLSISAPISEPSTFNFQSEFINDWNEPNDIAENMDD